MSRPTLPDTASQGDTGHVDDHNTIVDALTELYGEHSEGAGTPEGTVTATPGRTYADTTGGNLWVKNTGTGNTGWQSLPRVTAVDATTGRLAIGGIEMGDTGTRLIGTLLTNGYVDRAAASISSHLRRIGNTVHLQIWTGTASAPTSADVLTLPVGFRPPRWCASPVMNTTNAAGAILSRGLITNAGLVQFSASPSGIVTMQVTYHTAEAWPATLPGTAA